MNAQVDVLKEAEVRRQMDEWAVMLAGWPAHCIGSFESQDSANNLAAAWNGRRAAVAALIAERDAMRFALRDIATNCRRGAHEHGMTPHGVSAIAAICDAALTTGESA